MNSVLPVILYSFGFVSLTAFTQLPYRLWQLSVGKELYSMFTSNRTMALLGTVTGLTLPFYICLWGSLLQRLSVCLV